MDKFTIAVSLIPPATIRTKTKTTTTYSCYLSTNGNGGRCANRGIFADKYCKRCDGFKFPFIRCTCPKCTTQTGCKDYIASKQFQQTLNSQPNGCESCNRRDNHFQKCTLHK